MASRGLDAYLAWTARIVDEELERVIPGSEVEPKLLHQAMRYAVFPGGKRLRPALALASCGAVGGAGVRALPAAAAVELIHCYSLVHDDLPCMDDDDERRGMPSCHKAFGETMAVLAGDALLTLAFEVLSSEHAVRTLGAPACAAVAREIAAAAGSLGMVGGQAMDMTVGRQEPDRHALDALSRLKTGALFRAAVRSGALVGGAGERTLAVLTEYAEAVGLAFQIADDVLDAGPACDGSAVAAGAPPGLAGPGSAAPVEPSYVNVLGAECALDLAGDLCRRAVTLVECLGGNAGPLADLARFIWGQCRSSL